MKYYKHLIGIASLILIALWLQCPSKTYPLDWLFNGREFADKIAAIEYSYQQCPDEDELCLFLKKNEYLARH